MTHDPTEALDALSRLRALTLDITKARLREADLANKLRDAKQATRDAIKARERAFEGELAELPLFDGEAAGNGHVPSGDLTTIADPAPGAKPAKARKAAGKGVAN